MHNQVSPNATHAEVPQEHQGGNIDGMSKELAQALEAKGHELEWVPRRSLLSELPTFQLTPPPQAAEQPHASSSSVIQMLAYSGMQLRIQGERTLELASMLGHRSWGAGIHGMPNAHWNATSRHPLATRPLTGFFVLRASLSSVQLASTPKLCLLLSVQMLLVHCEVLATFNTQCLFHVSTGAPRVWTVVQPASVLENQVQHTSQVVRSRQASRHAMMRILSSWVLGIAALGIVVVQAQGEASQQAALLANVRLTLVFLLVKLTGHSNLCSGAPTGLSCIMGSELGHRTRS